MFFIFPRQLSRFSLSASCFPPPFPGLSLTILLLPHHSIYHTNQGFIACALLYILLACVGDRLIDQGLGGVALLLYGGSFLFFNFGPGYARTRACMHAPGSDGSNSPTISEMKPTHQNSATTYLYPTKLFPPEAKASLNGVAAAAGKIGASLSAD